MKKQGSIKYERLLICYFSGTGNALFAARKIAEIAENTGCKVSLQNIADKNPDFTYIKKNKNVLIGFCFPTHGFNAPPIVLKFVSKFPKNKSDVFLLNTRAGMKLYKIHTAGLGGIALWLPALILLLKGYRPIGFRPLDMPSNWISLHPGLRTQVVDSISGHCSKTISTFTHRIMNRKPVLNGLLWLPLDIALLPISIGYYFYGRFAIAKTFFANYNCANCGLCIKQCPVKAIKSKSNRPYWTFNCESCMKCMNNCPHRAIETCHGFTFLLWWLAFSFIPLLILKALLKLQIISASIYYNYFDLLINSIIIVTGLIVVFFGYKILHRFLGIRIMNKLITYSSLTHYKFWRRYKNSSDK